MSSSIEFNLKSSQAESSIEQTSPNSTCFVDELDCQTPISKLKQLCEESVENIRQIIIHLGAVLKDSSYSQSRLSDIFATPQYVIERNIIVLTNVHKEIKARKLAIKTVDNRPFCGTYFTVENVKDFGFRGIDYLAAIVALSLVAVSTSDSLSSSQNLTFDTKEAITKGSFTACLLVISKVLSAVTDYRNKKKYDREVEMHQLDELSYKCKKAKEAKGLLTILKSITNPAHYKCCENLRRFNLKTIEQLILHVDDPLDFDSLKLLKDQIRCSFEQKMKGQLKLKCPSLMADIDPDSIIKKVFLNWKSYTFDKANQELIQEVCVFTPPNPMTLNPPNLLSLWLQQAT
jgi:hypothetical protein